MEKKICIKNSCGKIYTPENDEEYETRTCCGICGAPVEVDLGDYPYEIVEEERIIKKIRGTGSAGGRSSEESRRRKEIPGSRFKQSECFNKFIKFNRQ